jgi:hypothetical protein
LSNPGQPRKRRRFVVGSVTVSMTLLVLAFFAPSPAQAYGLLTFDSILVNTSTCDGESSPFSNHPSRRDGYCWMWDEVDGTWWRPDEGGRGLRYAIWYYPKNGGDAEFVGKVEWHPYGEHLWVYDTKNDGDTLYIRLRVPSANYDRTFHAPGTANRVDIGHFDLDFAESLGVTVSVYDGPNHTDLMRVTPGATT